MSAPTEIPARFSRVRTYLEGLPDGLASYPECRVKSSLFRAIVESIGTEALEGLPGVVLDMVHDPKPISSWIPHVYGNVVSAAIRDVVLDSDQAFSRCCYEAQAGLFSSPAYKLLMIAASPRMVLKAIQARWSAFNQGTTATGHVENDTGGLHLRHPVGLFDGCARASVVEALRASMELARGGHVVEVEVLEASTTGFTLHTAWRPRA